MAPVQPKQSVSFNSSCHLIKYMATLTIKHIFAQTQHTHYPQNVTFPPLVFRCGCKYPVIERFIKQTYVPGYCI